MEMTTADRTAGPVVRRPAPPGPVAALGDSAVIARALGNGFLQRTATLEEDDCGCGCGGGGGCGGEVGRMVQPKLDVGAADGADEREADVIADQVLGMAGVTGRPGRTSAALAGLPAIQRAPATAGGSAGSVDAPLPSGSGRPLAPPTLAFMEPRFGQDFTGVRVHTGPDTDSFAAGIRARAFTHGHDIYLRQGESEQNHRLLAHELTHVVQQRGGAAATVQRAISPELDEIDDLLSYGLLDWAVTDAEALRALAILKTLPRFQQAAFFADVKYSARLRDNLPGAQIPELDALAAQVSALEPPAATLAAINDRLSYGLFDWAITDRDAVESLEMLKKLHGAQLATALATINYDRLLDNLPDARKQELRGLHDVALGSGGTRQTEEAEHPGTRIASITFQSDHGLLKDNTADWTRSGGLYGEPEWSAAGGKAVSRPISQTKNTNVQVEVGLDVLPENAPTAPVRLAGRSSEAALTFDFAGSLDGGRDRRLALTSAGKLPDTIRGLEDKEIVWTIDWRGWNHEIARTRHTVFVTADTPSPAAEITDKRMRKAIEIGSTVVGIVGGIDPHPMVREIMRNWGTYNLQVQYANEWELAGNIAQGAQCIDIVRFVQSVLRMVGVPGTATAVVVWAQPGTPTVAVESLWPHGGLHTVPNHPAHPDWFVGLIDANGCPNAFEAALRFDYGGLLRYYPGGVPVDDIYSTPQDVLNIFQCYAWLTSIGPGEFNIEQIGATYPNGSCSLGRIRCH